MDRGQDASVVGLVVHPLVDQGVAPAGSVSHEARPALPLVLVAGCRYGPGPNQEGPDEVLVTPTVGDQLHELGILLTRRTPRIVHVTLPDRLPAPQEQAGRSLRIRRGEHRTDRSAVEPLAYKIVRSLSAASRTARTSSTRVSRSIVWVMRSDNPTPRWSRQMIRAKRARPRSHVLNSCSSHMISRCEIHACARSRSGPLPNTWYAM